MSDYTILSAPRITLRGFRAILTRASSPAAGEAGPCYAAAVAAGVDPAVLLAVFRHESGYGTAGRARGNRSWGNVRGRSSGDPFPIDSGRFRIYPTWTAGAADAARLLAVYGHDLIRPGTDTSTVHRFPFVWAPAADGNAPRAYGLALAWSIAAWSQLYPTSSPAPVPIPRRTHYTVRRGDSLWAIGSRFGVDWHRIYAANRRRVGPNPSRIRVGLRLVIPRA